MWAHLNVTTRRSVMVRCGRAGFLKVLGSRRLLPTSRASLSGVRPCLGRKILEDALTYG